MIILVVEDEALVAFAIEWSLKIAGHHVLGPTDEVEEAIKLSDEQRPDLALVDLNLRDGGDGTVVARHLRQRHGTPTLFLSAQATQARANRDVAMGLVRKPYDVTSLPRIVRFVSDVVEGRNPREIPRGLEFFGTLDG
jgi:DNA-binding response OmpR family regulator